MPTIHPAHNFKSTDQWFLPPDTHPDEFAYHEVPQIGTGTYPTGVAGLKQVKGDGSTSSSFIDKNGDVNIVTSFTDDRCAFNVKNSDHEQQ